MMYACHRFRLAKKLKKNRYPGERFPGLPGQSAAHQDAGDCLDMVDEGADFQQVDDALLSGPAPCAL